ncbi:MAG: hypothetical protein GF375_03215 [Candidatus Omnitrophica bacterium]|nr:hypothetical protein [Candidatus Omnitrophota bacterium]MBD3269093.1 hypothetical protein [Candidatus Omnitrophota bacterium]
MSKIFGAGRYDKKFDYRTKKEIKKRQFVKIKQALNHAYKNSKFYRNLYRKNSITPKDIKNLEDFKNIPVVSRRDLYDYNWEIPAVSKNKWIDISVTSGTTRKPTFIPYTRGDLSRMAKITSILHNIAGIKRGDIVQITYPLGTGMWVAGFHNWLGLYNNNICSLRFGPGFTESQLNNALTLGSSVFLGSPSFMARLKAFADSRREFRNFKPRLICVCGQNIVNSDFTCNKLGRQLKKLWRGTVIKPVYGASEGPICGTVCDKGVGYHIPGEFFYLEILDKDNRNLEEGKKGRLVITSLGTEAFPLIRYAIGDISFLMKGRCSCGWSSARMGPISTRIDELLKFKGLLINPYEISETVSGLEGINNYYLQAFNDTDLMDKLRIIIAVEDKKSKNEKERVGSLVRKTIKSKFRINTEILIESREAVNKKIFFTEKGESRRKPVRFFDIRKKRR